MSLKAMPFLYLNLGGEMMYIIEQRLNAQNICRVKAEKVINDILQSMFDEPFVSSLFAKQQLKDREYIDHLFHRIVHSSIMKLNDQSMAKLLELMSMVFKQQLVFCLKPSDLYDITLNHMESVNDLTHSNDVCNLIKAARERFVGEYASASEIEMQFVRQTLLSYFLDVKTRVSVFIHDGTQEMDGTFVLTTNDAICTRNQLPGSILHFDDSGEIQSQTTFEPEAQYKRDTRRTLLGLNIYGKEENECKESSNGASQQTKQQAASIDENQCDDQLNNSDAYEASRREKQLLSALLGKTNAASLTGEYGLWFDFDENKENGDERGEQQVKVTEIKADNNRGNLAKINEEFTIEEERTEGSDFLDLMDSV